MKNPFRQEPKKTKLEIPSTVKEYGEFVIIGFAYCLLVLPIRAVLRFSEWVDPS